MFMYTVPSRSSTAAHSSEASVVISSPLCQVRPPSSLRRANDDWILPAEGDGLRQVTGPGLASDQHGTSSLPLPSWMPWPGPVPR